MYKIVLKVPEAVFLIFIFLPIFLIIGGYFPDPLTKMALSLLGLFTGAFWILGVSDYFDKASGNTKTDWILISLMILLIISAVRDIHQNFMDGTFIYHTESDFPVFTLIFDLILGILVTIKVKKVLYARSSWFILFEIMAYAFGVATLTPEIKNHYKENRKKMDKVFSGEQEEDLLD